MMNLSDIKVKILGIEAEVRLKEYETAAEMERELLYEFIDSLRSLRNKDVTRRVNLLMPVKSLGI